MRYIILLCLLLPLSVHASSLELAERFIALSDITKVKGATAADIEAVAALLSDDMRYQHPNFNADLSKQQFLEGLRHYMGAADSLSTTITNHIASKQAVTIAMLTSTVTEGNEELDSEPLMRLFEFKHGKITLIREYW
ncbi:nuclear transport factor 2 family protein [Thalassotalea ponticola]|uniref:nuclear transport factor 2 family protein n=1 Tax=Thalassotalea ponticola TaxID=1523392 RepID=UPI0025B58AFE|nr:nuclear transport factor 2 family protein [Thalassotalea ponticola]MDN3652513.1 nuclear transport factor 2 family protein [Thalassotalea ponticola]